MEQTAMQEHIQWLKDTLEISKEQAPILCNCISLCISDAESRLQKEKEHIINAWNNGYDELDRASRSPFHYYHETFKSE
jgi:hemoglobin-like flavoprotein